MRVAAGAVLRYLSALAVILAVASVTGCEPQGAGAGTEAATGQRREGHCFVAQLIELHPLYEDLRNLEKAVRALSLPEKPLSELPAFEARAALPTSLTAGPVALKWPGSLLTEHRDLALEALAQKPLETPDMLPGDLKIGLGWQRRQAQSSLEGRLLEERSRASQEYAAAARDLYQRNQERLTSPGMGETVEGVRQELEAELEKLRQQHEQRLAQVEESLRGSATARIGEAERSVWARAKERLRPPAGANDQGLAEAMREGLRDFEVPQWPAEVKTDLPLPRATPTEGMTLEQAEKQRAAARKVQLEELAAARNRVTARILAATRLAAEKVARDKGITLHFVPEDDAIGPDLTPEIRDAVRMLWSSPGQS
ncbi:hypothetical protein LLH03_10325 [bacterium]|nr:hypothetical protein [bacterium]